MKKLFLVITVTFNFIWGAFAHNVNVQVKLEQGPVWKKRAPQCAVWIEDTDGTYGETIFVTKSASKKAWKFSPADGRPDSLPVWYNASSVNPADVMAAEGRKEIDAVTGATPKAAGSGKASADDGNTCWKIELQAGKTYVIRVEVNQSFDYNDHWTKNNSGVNGQPSVVYSKTFTVKNEISEYILDFAGTGSIDGSNGKISKDEIEFLTTAKDIISRIIVTVGV